MQRNKPAITATYSGFTLAETLITLMIIGILAAITLPAISRSIEKNILKNQFKKAYANIVQAMFQTQAEDGYRCYYNIADNGTNADCRAMWDSFYKKLNVIKFCKGNSLENGCIPQYALPSGGTCAYTTQDRVDKVSYTRMLKDNTVLIAYGTDDFQILLFDINGKKGPNKPGFDLFALSLVKNKNGNVTFQPNDRWSQNILHCLTPSSDAYFKSLDDIFKY